jgi:hypothetical protein
MLSGRPFLLAVTLPKPGSLSYNPDRNLRRQGAR